MPTSAVYEAVVRYRAALLARERAAATALVRYYGEAWARLQADINATVAYLEAKRLAGEEITPGMLVRLDRMRAIQEQTAAELERYVGYADITIQDGKRWSIAAGERQAFDLVQLSFPRGAVNVQFYRMPRDAAESLIGLVRDGTPVRDVLVKYAGDAAQALSETMVTGIVAGWNPRKLAREMRSSFGMGLTESIRLARTEQLRAYRAATLETYRANDDIVKGWTRRSARLPNSCLACLMEDGREYGLDEQMDDHPNGKCYMVPRTVTYAELGIDAPEPEFNPGSGKEWFEAQSEQTQRGIMGAISKDAYDAWKAGLFSLEDVPQHIDDATWGGHWANKPMFELLGLDAPRRSYADLVQGVGE